MPLSVLRFLVFYYISFIELLKIPDLWTFSETEFPERILTLKEPYMFY